MTIPFPDIQGAFARYSEDLRKGRSEGIIRYARPGIPLRGLFDRDAHLPDKLGFGGRPYRRGTLNHSNTRKLSALGTAILDHMGSDGPLRVLVLGHGSGTECYGIRKKLREKGIHENSSVHSVGLTPFSPFLGIEYTAREIEEALPELVQYKHGITLALLCRQALRGRKPGNPYSFRLRLDALLELQSRTGKQFVKTLDRPFVDLQIIARFPDEADLAREYYDVIYEGHGPLAKAELPSQRTACEKKILHALKPSGVFIFKRAHLAVHDIFRDASVLAVLGADPALDDENDCFLVRKDSDLGARIEACAAMLPRRGKNILAPYPLSLVEQVFAAKGPAVR